MSTSPVPTARFELFFDGDCPLCAREVGLLRRLDGGRGRLALVDIAAPDFDASTCERSHAELMARIHGRLPDGTWVEGVEVFRRAYGAVGLGWLLAPTRWPLIGPLADAAYRVFARNRLRWTGRDGCEAGQCPRVSEGPPVSS